MAKAAPFGAMDKKAVTGVGAPWYVSGIQEWKGTAPILNPSAAKMSRNPMIKPGVAGAEAMSENTSFPVSPYTKLMP